MNMAVMEVQRGIHELYGSGTAGHGGPQISNVTLLGSGYDTDVFAFSLSTVGEEAGEAQDLVLRIYAGEDTAEKAAREFAVMQRLREAGYPVPRVLDLTRDPSPFGRPFVIMERIHGVSLGPSYWGAPVDRRQEFQTVLYRLMVALHAIEGSAILPDSPLAHLRDPYGCIDHEIAVLSELLHRLDGRESPSLRHVLTWLISRRSTVPCGRPAVVHGDFHPNNVLVCADDTAFVIDWSNVRLTDYRADLAWSRLITGATVHPDGSAADLRIYEQLAGKAVTEIEYFEAAACTRLLLSQLISLQFGATRQGMRPDAEADIRRNADYTRSVAALLRQRTGIGMSDLEDALAALLE